MTKLAPLPDRLTVATYNVENLAGYQGPRIMDLAETISSNLKCPDIVSLVEIQDFNGISFAGGASADLTLNLLIKALKCGDYASVNIDPYLHAEGGQPGGNIRVSMIYNKRRVSFTPIINNNPLAPVIVLADGSLTHNPGRVSPNAKAFERTRKSLVAEFKFRGQRVIVIGNHFNSKLGDISLWGAQQPPLFKSELRRARIATEINLFVERIYRNDPQANVLVVGDFNAFFTEQPMKILEGNILRNLINYNNLIAENDRYTTNHNGNSQALDYIFANLTLLAKNPEAEIIHINSDYMGKFSDHDPVIARFLFK